MLDHKPQTSLAERLYQHNWQKLAQKLPGTDLADILGRSADGSVHRGSGWFYFLPHIYGRALLSNDPATAVSAHGVKLRGGLTHWLYLRLGRFFLEGHKQIVVRKEPLPTGGRPLIFVPNHYFMQDPLATIMLAEKHSYLVFGTLPHFFNTKYGPEAYLNGSILLNRRDKANRHAVIEKAARVLEQGAGLIIFPEGGWNKSPNRLVLPLWRGVFRIAKRTQALVIPIVNLKADKLIYSSRLAPLDICQYSEAEEAAALDTLRDTLATELYRLMEQYARTTRAQLLGEHRTMHEYCEATVRAQAETSGYYYDCTVEAGSNAADLRLPGAPYAADVWRAVAGLPVSARHIHAINYAKRLLAEDYQRRF